MWVPVPISSSFIFPTIYCSVPFIYSSINGYWDHFQLPGFCAVVLLLEIWLLTFLYIVFQCMWIQVFPIPSWIERGSGVCRVTPTVDFLIGKRSSFVCSKVATLFLSAEFIFQKWISTSWHPVKWLLSQGSSLWLLAQGTVLEGGPCVESWLFHLLTRERPKHLPCSCHLPPAPHATPHIILRDEFWSLGPVGIMNFVFQSLSVLL